MKNTINKINKANQIYNLFFGITTFCTVVSSNNLVSAQITPDNTLPNNSQVGIEGNITKINGGTRNEGNLFHSFEKFGVSAGTEAHFNNAADIQNIFTRVTGKSFSDIDGLIKANGTANLFLINPNGIVFGENARLDIGGSFVGSTADAIRFGEDNFFNASNPDSSSLLKIKPDALFFNQVKAASIQNNSVADSGLNLSGNFTARGLRVPDSKSLLLVGGDININRGGLYSFGGRVELAGLSGKGTVGLNQDGNNLSLTIPDGVEKSNISFNNGAGIDVISSNAGSIAIGAKNLSMSEESFFFAGIEADSGSEQSRAGNIDLNITQAINLRDGSIINNQIREQAKGRGGNININTGLLQLENGAQIDASTFGQGNAGNLIINAQNILLKNGSALLASVKTDGTGNAGNLEINTNNLSVQSRAAVFTGTFSSGNAGNLNIKTNSLQVLDGSQITTSTFSQGQGGELNIEAENIDLIGTAEDSAISSGLFTSSQPNTTGDAGNLMIQTNSLKVENGASIDTSTFGEGKVGNLSVNAQQVQIIGVSKDGQAFSNLAASTLGDATGAAGNLTINTDSLLIKDGAVVSVQNIGKETAGNIDINAKRVQLDEGFILASTSSNNGGNINLEISDLLLMSNGSDISSTAGLTSTGGNGGNININAPDGFIVATPNQNSDIKANAFEGNGGRVKIDATGIFGMVSRSREELVNLLGTNDPAELNPSQLPTNDITAISQQNPNSGGTVEVIIPQTDPNSSLIELPTTTVETEVVNTCTTPGYAQSSFTITGKGSLPPSPFEPLTGRVNQTKLATLDEVGEIKVKPRRSRKKKEESQIKQIVEARGWVRTKNGEIFLVANPPQNNNYQAQSNSHNCNR